MVNSIYYSNSKINPNYLNPNKNGYRNSGVPSFKSQPEADTVTLSTDDEKKKKKLSKGAKWGIGLSAGIATIIGGSFLICRGQANRLTKLYKEKLVLSNLSEKINFKDAKSLDEAIKFSKETLGIKNLNGFDKHPEKEALEALNWINKSLVDISNAHKGKAFLPMTINFKPIEKENIAHVIRTIEADSFGDLTINSIYINHEFLNKNLTERFKPQTSNKGSSTTKRSWQNVSDKSYIDLRDKFLKNKNSLSLREKIFLYETNAQILSETWQMVFQPINFLKRYENLFKENNIKIDFTELEKMSKDDLTKKFKELLNELASKRNKPLDIYIKPLVPETTIYHEMGHLQDYAKNLEKIDINSWKFWKKDSNQVNNHFGRIKDKEIKELFDKDKELFKLMYPDLYEHITNKEIIATAGKVSTYAQCGIGEFIAETYAKLIQGHKLDDDVIALYKKYGGPEVF